MVLHQYTVGQYKYLDAPTWKMNETIMRSQTARITAISVIAPLHSKESILGKDIRLDICKSFFELRLCMILCSMKRD